MAVRRTPAGVSTGLPANIAAGPAPALWGEGQQAVTAWRAAGDKWAAKRGMAPGAWRALLPADVLYAVSSLGRAHIRHGGLIAPWDQ